MQDTFPSDLYDRNRNHIALKTKFNSDLGMDRISIWIRVELRIPGFLGIKISYIKLFGKKFKIVF